MSHRLVGARFGGGLGSLGLVGVISGVVGGHWGSLGLVGARWGSSQFLVTPFFTTIVSIDEKYENFPLQTDRLTDGAEYIEPVGGAKKY